LLLETQKKQKPANQSLQAAGKHFISANSVCQGSTFASPERPKRNKNSTVAWTRSSWQLNSCSKSFAVRAHKSKPKSWIRAFKISMAP